MKQSILTTQESVTSDTSDKTRPIMLKVIKKTKKPSISENRFWFFNNVENGNIFLHFPNPNKRATT